MLAKVESVTPVGIDTVKVDVEVDISSGLPAFNIVGLPDMAVKEAKERVRAGILNSEFTFPLRRITVNLAPANVKKEGPIFDLPVAVGILVATRQLPAEKLADFFLVGEISLTGGIRGIKGALLTALAAKKAGKKGVIVPQENALEAALVEDIEVIPVGSLRQVVEFLKGRLEIKPLKCDLETVFSKRLKYEVDFSEVKGQAHAKRALEIAAAGAHNVLMIGPPGSGKTMLAKRLPTILPDITLEEAIEITKIYSVAGLLSSNRALITHRPFRNPHHTISNVGLIGGGQHPKPGEVSLSHHGVLFLDEFPEFQRSALEVLRQPLEDGKVTISRALSSLTYPARFTLVAAMNPCPCGFLGDSTRECICTPRQVENYRKKISGPLLDRIDIHVNVPRLKKEELLSETQSELSRDIRERVERARERQRERFKKAGFSKIFCNAQMKPKHLRKIVRLTIKAQDFLEKSFDILKLSARAYDRILKVSLTVADLEGSDVIDMNHVAEAIQYRILDRRQFEF